MYLENCPWGQCRKENYHCFSSLYFLVYFQVVLTRKVCINLLFQFLSHIINGWFVIPFCLVMKPFWVQKDHSNFLTWIKLDWRSSFTVSPGNKQPQICRLQMVENFNWSKTHEQNLRTWACICLVPKSVEWKAGLALLCQLLPSINKA